MISNKDKAIKRFVKNERKNQPCGLAEGDIFGKGWDACNRNNKWMVKRISELEKWINDINEQILSGKLVRK